MTLDANGSFTYVPAAGFSGTDSFTYQANDGTANSNVATVSIHVLLPVSLTLPTNVAGTAGQTVTVPITFDNRGNEVSSLIFSIDYAEGCLQIDPTDANSDDILDAVTFNLPAGVTHTAQLNSENTDGKLAIVIIDNTGSIASGTLANLTLMVSSAANCAGSTAPVSFSVDPAPTFGDLMDGQIPGVAQNGSVLISGDPAAEMGNCNDDGQIDASDITALIFEIFDGDGNARTDTPNGTFAGSAICDANNDTVINAADISCVVLIIFNGQGACGDSGVTDAGAEASAQLSVPQQLTAVAGNTVDVPVLLQPEDQQVTAATFALTFDPNVFTFDPTDSDKNGIPGAVTVPMLTNYESQVSYDAANGRIMVAVFANTSDVVPFAAGALATVTLTVQAGQSGDHELTLADSSLGSAAGQTVAVTLSDGSLQIVSETQNLLYLPVMIVQ